LSPYFLRNKEKKSMSSISKLVKSFVLCASAFAYVSLAQAQEPFVVVDENFESDYKPANWLFVDKDGDKLQWNLGEMYSEDAKAHSGSKILFSLSQNPETNESIKPDNWVILPSLGLRAEGELTFWIAVRDIEHGAEHFGVFASTTNNKIESFTQTLYQETIDVKARTHLRSTASQWMQRTVKIPKECRYIAFRHYNCEGQFLLMLDDVRVTTKVQPIPESRLKVNGVEIASTQDNADVLGDGTVRYEAINKTLTLNNATLDKGGIEVSNGELYIQLEGENSINLQDGSALFVDKRSSLTLAGEGELSLSTFGNAAIGLDEEAKLTIRGAKVSADGSVAGILGAYGNRGEKLVLVGADVYATGLSASIASLQELSLRQCKVTQPSDAQVTQGKLSADDNLAMGIYDAEGYAVTSAQIEPEIAEGGSHKVTLKVEGVGTLIAKGYTQVQLEAVLKGATVPLDLNFDASKYELVSLQANGKDIATAMEVEMGDDDLEIVAVLRAVQSAIEVQGVAQGLSLYPNPAQNEAAVGASQATYPLAISVFDMAGVLQLEGALREGEKLDTSVLADGVYIVKTANGNLAKLVIRR